MFQQTFLQTDPSNRKPFSLGVSLLLQAALIALLATIPLLVSPRLPVAQLRSFLLVPPPPTATPINRAVTPSGRILTSHRFVFHPDTVNRLPRSISRTLEDVPPILGIDVTGTNNEPFGTASSILGTMGKIPAPLPQTVAKPAAPKTSERKLVRVGSVVSEANLVHKVQPIYPPLARTARVSGTVEFSATISREGVIENLQLVHGHPLLVDAARQAIQQWRYKPTMLNGQAVEVITSIIVTFNLN